MSSELRSAIAALEARQNSLWRTLLFGAWYWAVILLAPMFIFEDLTKSIAGSMILLVISQYVGWASSRCARASVITMLEAQAIARPHELSTQQKLDSLTADLALLQMDLENHFKSQP